MLPDGGSDTQRRSCQGSSGGCGLESAETSPLETDAQGCQSVDGFKTMSLDEMTQGGGQEDSTQCWTLDTPDL